MNGDQKKYRLAALTSHPIQYQGPLFKAIAQHPQVDFSVYFSWEAAREKSAYDREFGARIQWDIPLLEGYRHTFLKNWSLRPSSEFWGQINFGIVPELIQKKYDAVLIFGWNSFTNWIAFCTAFLIGLPVMLRGENPLSHELLKSPRKIRLKKIILGWLFKRIAAFLYIGEENKKFYAFYGASESKLFFAPYAVDNNRFIAASKALNTRRQALRKEMDIREDDVVILFVGKLIQKKRPMDLLRAYQLQVTGHKAQVTHLVFVGDGHLRLELENYVKEHSLKNVIFAGFKNQSELPKYYAISDIIILPSGAGETWGLAVNEGMCFGLIPIVSDLVGCGPDLVRHGENGFVFTLGDISALGLYMSELTADREKRQVFSKKSFEIIQGYSYDKDIEAIIKALRI